MVTKNADRVKGGRIAAAQRKANSTGTPVTLEDLAMTLYPRSPEPVTAVEDTQVHRLTSTAGARSEETVTVTVELPIRLRTWIEAYGAQWGAARKRFGMTLADKLLAILNEHWRDHPHERIAAGLAHGGDTGQPGDAAARALAGR